MSKKTGKRRGKQAHSQENIQKHIEENNLENQTMDEKDDASKSEAEKLSDELAQMKDKHHRLYAEFDNYRKRTMKEKAEMVKSATGDLIIELLPVLDDFERALNVLENNEGDAGGIEGVRLIYNKLKSILEKKGLKKMDVIGKEFNPEFHEAIAQVPVQDEELKNKIVDVIENGYMLHDKVLRFAKVVVGV